MKLLINGEFKEKHTCEELLEPGFLFGWGVFEPLRVYAGKAAFLDEHLARLNNSCRLLNLELPSVDWPTAIIGALKENDLQDAYVRLTAYKKRKNTGFMVYADNFAYYAPQTYDNGFSTAICTIPRNENDIACKVKTISYLNNRLAWHQAQGKGKDEALMVNLKGNLAGGSRSNLFIITDDCVVTPRLEDGAFCGITRQKVIQILKGLKLKVREKKILPQDLFESKEAFLTSSLLEVMALASCDDKAIGSGKPGTVTSHIHAKYRERIHG